MTELVLSDRVAAGGDIIGRLEDGRVLFVEGALPEERVRVDITERRRDYARARTVAVLDASPDRVRPPCPELERGCGGCPWQHARPAAQLELKERIVRDALRRLGHLDGPIEVVGVAQPATEHYRTTAHLSVGPEGVPAYHRRRDRGLVEVGGCLVAHPRLEELIVGGRFPGQPAVTLRVGVAGGERLVVLRGPARRPPVVPDGTVVVEPGRTAAFHEDVGGRRWRVSARSFFQAGPSGAGALVDAVAGAVGDAIGPGDRLIDAYAGVGLLGGVVAARRGARLVAVEQHRQAAADARLNLTDLEARVVTAEVGRWKAEPAEVVIADPARPGLGRPGVGVLVGAGAGRFVLVSCDPASLARDAVLLQAEGYRLGPVRIVDLFSHTPHIETVARFDRVR